MVVVWEPLFTNKGIEYFSKLPGVDSLFLNFICTIRHLKPKLNQPHPYPHHALCGHPIEPLALRLVHENMIPFSSTSAKFTRKQAAMSAGAGYIAPQLGHFGILETSFWKPFWIHFVVPGGSHASS